MFINCSWTLKRLTNKRRHFVTAAWSAVSNTNLDNCSHKCTFKSQFYSLHLRSYHAITFLGMTLTIIVQLKITQFRNKWLKLKGHLFSFVGGRFRSTVHPTRGENKQHKRLRINPSGAWSVCYYAHGAVISAHETGKESELKRFGFLF